MSIDLTAAIEAAQDAARNMPFDWACEENPELRRYECRECVAKLAIEAAAPLIERAVLEQFARDIEQSGRLMRDRIESYAPEIQERINGNVDGRLSAALLARRTS